MVSMDTETQSDCVPAGGTPDPVTSEQELLAKLEEANRRLEADEKSANALLARSPTPGHSRKGSGSSVISTTSSNSHYSAQVSCDDDQVAHPTESLWETWGRIVNEWDSVKKKQGYVKELVRKGIPHHFRGIAWQLILNVHDSQFKQLYAEYLKKTSPCEKLIRRDIARTFPDHEFFKEKDGLGQESLFNVMKAYSLHDREVGYCQGSGFIVGLLLMQMPEEEAFAVLVRLMQEYRMRELFKPSMAELGLCMYKLECLIQELLPDLHLHFQSQNFHTTMYASSWFLTLFTTSLPLSLACRIMDVFISEGMEMIFRVGMAILQTSHEDLMSLDMEGMLKYFQKDVRAKYENDTDLLLQSAYQVRYSSKKMKKLEKEYTALKSKENEEQIELRRLRTENRLLRQRIDNLEKESASLADRLIQDQVIRAQEAEEMYALKNELSVLKQSHLEAQKKIEDADILIAEVKRRTKCIDEAAILDDENAKAIIKNLQEELISVRLKEAETNMYIKELKTKIKELEDINLKMQRAPSNDVQHLQEELVAVKLREAEANLSLKELRQKVNEIEAYWESYMERQNSVNSPKEKSSKQELKQLQEELMTVKVREAQALAESKETKQKVMELETQNHISGNQIRRMDDDNKSLKSRLQDAAEHEREMKTTIKELMRKIDDMESRKKEESMMSRIKEAENTTMIAELKQKIANIEIQKEELLTAGQLHGKGSNQDLENQIYDLQDEVLQLKLTVAPPNGSRLSTSMYRDDSDDDVSEALEDSESLNRTLSELVEGKSTSFLDNGDIDDVLGVTNGDSSLHDVGGNVSVSDKTDSEAVSQVTDSDPQVNGESVPVDSQVKVNGDCQMDENTASIPSKVVPDIQTSSPDAEESVEVQDEPQTLPDG